MAAVSYLNLFARDIEALSRFYRDVFGFVAIDAVSSPIFRAVDAGTCRIGFNAHDAYRLLGLAEPAGPAGVRSMVTVAVDDAASVDRLWSLALAAGATAVKPGYATAYGSHQAVLLDPEGHVVRIDAPRR